MIGKRIATMLIIALLLSATFVALVQGRTGDHIWEPFQISPGTYYGSMNSTHTDEWYNFTCYQGHLINVTVIPPPAPADFDLEVYDRIGRLGYSKKGPGYTENVTIPARMDGNHSIHVSRMEGSGSYTLILEPVNHIPAKPSAPAGYTSGYVYTPYTYTTSTIDPEADTISYRFDWGDGKSNTTSFYASNTTASSQHQWKHPIAYQVKVKAIDCHSDGNNPSSWSDYSDPTTVTLSQNDAGKGVDAPGSFDHPLNITSGSYKGTLYSNQTLNVTDTDDYYGVDLQVGNKIEVTMTPPADADFDLILKDPSGATKNISKLGTGQTERVTYTANVAGKWRILIYWAGTGEGQYSFSVKPPYALTFKTRKLTGAEITNVLVWIDGVQYYTPVTVNVDGGAHTVQATSTFMRGWFLYTFDHWEDSSYDNPRSITVNGDMTVTAYYDYEYVGTCPTLFVWNGTDYAYETLLNIHAGSDITLDHKIQQSLVRDGLFYKLQLQELDEFTSHIDQVKLYAVDSQGKAHVCPLKTAKKGDTFATLTLLLDDSVRVDLAPSETIDLRFIPSIPQRLTAYFVFEINGYNRKIL